MRARLFLAGWLLLPWGFLGAALTQGDSAPMWVVAPSLLSTIAGIICVKYALPKHLERRRVSGDVIAAAGALDADGGTWVLVMRASTSLVILSLLIGLGKQVL